MNKSLVVTISFFILGILLFCFLYIYACYIEPSWIRIHKVTIVDESLSRAFKGVKLVHISDLDFKGFSVREKRFVKLINSLNPDVVFFTGDFIDSWIYFSQAMDLFSKIRASFGIYAVAGDNDYSNIKDMKVLNKQCRKQGINLIQDRAVLLNFKRNPPFYLVGVDDYRNIPRVLRPVLKENKPVILLCHKPKAVYPASKFNVNIVFSGDTHGGQINPGFLRDLSDFSRSKETEFVYGLYRQGNTLLYVSRGIGTSQRNIRFLCRPEIAVVEFKEKGRMSSVKPKENIFFFRKLVRFFYDRMGVKKIVRFVYRLLEN